MPPKRKVSVNDTMGVCPMDIDQPEAVVQPKKKRKTYIPKSLRLVVWRNAYGEDAGSGLCKVCNSTKIYQADHHCSHIVAEAEGGETKAENLLPTCGLCNSSMGKRNLNAFREAFFTKR